MVHGRKRAWPLAPRAKSVAPRCGGWYSKEYTCSLSIFRLSVHLDLDKDIWIQHQCGDGWAFSLH
ncbi:hypothetical protein QFZ97_004556 [Paraburkholderia youngii]